MDAYLKVTSKSGTIELNEKHITSIKYEVLTPDDSNARSTDVTYKLTVKGRIIPEILGSSGERVVDLHKWSLVKSGIDVYRNVEVAYDGEGITMRKYSLPKAFVMNYDEVFNDQDGTGTFEIVMCEKKDLNNAVMVSGGFPNAG